MAQFINMKAVMTSMIVRENSMEYRVEIDESEDTSCLLRCSYGRQELGTYRAHPLMSDGCDEVQYRDDYQILDVDVPFEIVKRLDHEMPAWGVRKKKM